MKKHLWKIFSALLLVCLTVGVVSACGGTKKYKVTYVGGTGTEGSVPASASYEEGVTFQVGDQGTLTKEDYSFAGWNDGTKTYQPGEAYKMPAKDVTFTAQWDYVPDTFTVRFLVDEDGEGGEDPIVLTVLTVEVVQGEAIGSQLPAADAEALDGLLPWGMKLVGWSTTNGGKEPIDGEWTPEDDTNLYAILEDDPNKTFTLAYAAGDGSGTQSKKETAIERNDQDGWVILPESDFDAPADKVFGYWTIGSDDADNEPRNYAATAYADLRELVAYVKEGVATFTAHWLTAKELAAVTHKVTLQDKDPDPTDTDDSITGVSGDSLFANATFEFPACTFSAPAGKEFDYWDYMDVHYAVGARAELQNSDWHAVAVWKDTTTPPSEKYTLSWDAGDAAAATGIPASGEYAEGESVSIPADPVCKGYEFEGWRAFVSVSGGTKEVVGDNSEYLIYKHDISGDQDDAYHKYFDTFTMLGEDVTLVAQWKDVFTVTYDLGDYDGGETVAAQTAPRGESVTLANAPAWSGHTFVCWQATVTGVHGTFSARYPEGHELTLTEDFSFTAVWTTKEQFTVKFSVNGTELTGKEITVKPGETLSGESLPTEDDYNTYLAQGEKFNGWMCGGEAIVALEDWMPVDDCTLTADILTAQEASAPTVTFYADEDKTESFVADVRAGDLTFKYFEDYADNIWWVKFFTNDHRFNGAHKGKTASGWYGYYDDFGGPARTDLVNEGGWAHLMDFSDEFSGETWKKPIELFAEWDETPVTYTVTFYADKADKEGGSSLGTATYSESQKLTEGDGYAAIVTAKKYYTFDYWYYLGGDGGAQEIRIDTQSVSDLITEGTELDVYAHYTQVESLPSETQTASNDAPITIGLDGNTSGEPKPDGNGAGVAGAGVQWTGKITKGNHYTYSGTQTSAAVTGKQKPNEELYQSILTYIWSGMTRHGFFRADRFIADDTWSDKPLATSYAAAEHWAFAKASTTNDFSDNYVKALNGTFSIDVDWTDEAVIVVYVRFTATGGAQNGYGDSYYTIVAAKGSELKDEYSIGFAAEKAQAKITSITEDQTSISATIEAPSPKGDQSAPVLGTDQCELRYTDKDPAWIGKSFKQGQKITLTGTIKSPGTNGYHIPIAYIMSKKSNYSSFRLDGCMMFSDHAFEGFDATVVAGLTGADVNYSGGAGNTDTDFLNAMKEGGVNFTLTYNWEEATKITITAVFSKDTVTRTTTFTITATGARFAYDEYYIGLGGENIYLQISNIAYPAAD